MMAPELHSWPLLVGSMWRLCWQHGCWRGLQFLYASPILKSKEVPKAFQSDKAWSCSHFTLNAKWLWIPTLCTARLCEYQESAPGPQPVFFQIRIGWSIMWGLTAISPSFSQRLCFLAFQNQYTLGQGQQYEIRAMQNLQDTSSSHLIIFLDMTCRELKYVLEDSQTSVVLSSADFSEQIEDLARTVGIEHMKLGQQVETYLDALECWNLSRLGQSILLYVAEFRQPYTSMASHGMKWVCIQAPFRGAKSSWKQCPCADFYLSFLEWGSCWQGDNMDEEEVVSSVTEECSKADVEDGSLIIYTSGTTGKPKGKPQPLRPLIRRVSLAWLHSLIYNWGWVLLIDCLQIPQFPSLCI